jgi:cell shape-determining protein MreC
MILTSLGGTFLGTFFGWFFGRKRQNIDTIDAAVETWKKIVDSLQEQIDRLLEQRASDAAKNHHIEQLQEQVASTEMKVKSVNRLEKTIARYEKLMDAAGIEY